MRELGQLPTTSFHEEAVSKFVTSYLSQLELEVVADAYGNLVGHYVSGQAGRRIALVAHMDHPGLEVIAVDSTQSKCRLVGWLDPRYLSSGIKVVVFSQGAAIRGTVTGAQVTERTAVLEVRSDTPLTVGAFGVFDLVDYERRGSKVYMRAADDLLGCGAMLLAAAEVVSSGVDGDIYFAFTRAEEEGMVGATLLARTKTIPEDATVVSLECSRALPGARSGGGPVIRVGDARQTFDWQAEHLLQSAAARLVGEPRFRFQRQLMSGGVCEATAFQVQGYSVTGVALPLGNYHNQGARFTIAPEVVEMNDFLSLVRLLRSLFDVANDPPKSALKERLEQLADKLAPVLGSSKIFDGAGWRGG